MRVLCAAAMIVLLAGPAYAQKQIPRYGEEDKDQTPSEIEADKAAERAYKKSLGNIPDQGASDPWGNVRSDTGPKPAPKANAKSDAKSDAKSEAKSAARASPAKPQAKTGSTTAN
jgi:hypothetical protein